MLLSALRTVNPWYCWQVTHKAAMDPKKYWTPHHLLSRTRTLLPKQYMFLNPHWCNKDGKQNLFYVILAIFKIIKSHSILHWNVAFQITNSKISLLATFSIPKTLNCWSLKHVCQEASSFKCNAVILPSLTNCHFMKQAELDPQL